MEVLFQNNYSSFDKIMREQPSFFAIRKLEIELKLQATASIFRMAGLLKSNVFWEKTVFLFKRCCSYTVGIEVYNDIKELFAWNR